MSPIRLLVVDDHEAFRRGVVSVLSQYPQVEVVAEAADGMEAVDAARRTRPDVVLLDLRMPGQDGLATIPRLMALDPAPRTLVLTVSEDSEELLAALQAGADGYLLKDLKAGTLLERIEEVAGGGVVLSASVGRLLCERLQASPAEAEPEAAGRQPCTPQEFEVLGLLSCGFTNAEIARALFLSERTVKTRVQNVLDKLRLHNRAEAALRARR